MQEMEVVAGLIRQCIEGNAAKAQDQEEYDKRYSGLVERFEGLKAQQDALRKERQNREQKRDVLSGFLFEVGEIYELDPVFCEQRWRAIVDHVTIRNNGKLAFCFKNGSEVTVEV